MIDHRNGPDQTEATGPRVAIFIDGSNLYHALEENCRRTDLSFSGFIQRLLRGRTLLRTYYYNILQDSRRKPQAYWQQQKFLSILYSTPYLEVRLGRSAYRRGVAIEKGVDIRLATDMLELAWRNLYETAILVSGDGDFAYAVQTVKNIGKFVEVACFESNQSRDLLEASDAIIALTPEFFEGLWVGSSN
ncbi:MAG: NYN domain-containing protein [Dehalococcoidia bacterium]